MTTKRLDGKVAIVTGAASGIGHASARLFAEHGAKVVAVDLPGSGIDTVHGDIPGIFALARSVTDEDAPQAMVEAAIDNFGGLDILFNNAGVAINALIESTTDADWDKTFDVNVRAQFRACRYAIPHLRKRAEQTGRARIINTASVMAEQTDIAIAAYTASKHAVAGLTKSLALELGKWKITANYLLPGAIYTGMTRENMDQADIRRVWEKKAALRRLGMPIDLANAALLLSQDEADFITGHGLVADGGLTLRV